MINTKRPFELDFIKVIVGLNVCLQILSVLRATALFNTAYVSNGLRLIIVSCFGVWFIIKFKNQKPIFEIWDAIFLFIPLAATGWGIFYSGLSRYTFSDLFNAIGFWMIFYTYKNQESIFDKKLCLWIANVELLGVIISFVLYCVFPLLGFPILSRGKVSNFILLPLAIYMIYGDKRSILVLILILWSGKRGVMLAAACMLLCFFVVSPKIKRKIKLGAIMGVIIAGIAICLFTYSPKHYAFASEDIRGVLDRIMYVNPISPYRDYYSDGRLDEVISALKSLKDNPFKIIIGNGSGFTYEYYFKGELISLTKHNVHMSPIDLVTKYGIIYATAMYINALLVLFKSTKIVSCVKNDNYYKEVFIMMLYICGTLIDSLTVCLLYADYQYIIILGILNGVFLINRSRGEDAAK